MFIFSKIDKLLDMTTMYRVVLYTLSALVLYAFLMSGLGLMGASLLSLLYLLVLLLGTALITHIVFKALFKAPAFIESTYITAFILFFVVAPPTTVAEKFWVMLIAFLAIASKYLIAYRHKHIFNPVAIALVLGGALGATSSVWWVGSSVMLVPTLIA